MKRSLMAALALFGVAAASASALAEPVLGFRFFEDNVLQASASTSSTNGQLLVNTQTTNFSVVSAIATGIPILQAPSMAVQTTSISSVGAFSGAHTLRLEFTQTDVPSSSAGGLFAQLASTMTSNFLANGNLIDAIAISNYANANNTTFGTETLLAQSTFANAGASASPLMITSLSLPNLLFSETMVFEVTFRGGGAALQASSQIVAVPEPASFALFGAALLGLGMVRRRNNA